MKIAIVTPGIIPIPPNGWGAIEKLIWEYHCNYQKLGHESKIVYLDQLTGDEDVVHIHVANLANMAHARGIPYYFTMSDHHTVLYGKDSAVYKQNYEAMKNAKKAFVGGKFLVEYFDGIPEYYPYGVNPDYFTGTDRTVTSHSLLCVANNGYVTDNAYDRKGFSFAIDAAKKLGLPITIAGPSNNKNYFERYRPEYDKLTILYDLDEAQLLETYRSHTIFVHPSELEAGHPNLTLLEALACGLPVVGTLEPDNFLGGMEIATRNVDSLVDGITKIIDGYPDYVRAARRQAEELSWYRSAESFIRAYQESPNKLRQELKREYLSTVISPKSKLIPTAQFVFSNIHGMRAEILGGEDVQYKARFINTSTGEEVYTTILSRNSWAETSVQYYVPWKVMIEDLHGNLIHEYIQTFAEDATVYIALDSKSLGDTLAWFPYIEEFRKTHGCKVVCSTFWNALLAGQYPELTFTKPGVPVNGISAMYLLGLFYDGETFDIKMHPNNPIQIPLQQIASDILGLEYREIKPVLKKPNVSNSTKQVSIGVHSTAQAKYWNNPTGWQEVVDWLHSEAFTVKLLSLEGTEYMGNKAPNGVILHPAGSIESVIEELCKSRLYIGLGSGLSWLAWALDVPVILISGFSEHYSEMQDCIRITAPKTSCSGCWNRHKFNPGDWNWCPDHKGTLRQFECSKNITSDMVIAAMRGIQKKPRIQIKHLLTRPTDAREQFSIQSIRRLSDYGMDYQPIVNTIFDGEAPKEHCRRPEDIADVAMPIPHKPGLGTLTGRHYGCYLAHRGGIESMDDSKYDYTVIFEADAYLTVDPEEFVNMLYAACAVFDRDGIYFVSFANNSSGEMSVVDSMFTKTAHYQDLAHCYMISNKHKQWWLDRINDCEWDSGDLWLNHIFCHHPQLRYTTNKVYSKQADGLSLLDGVQKTW